MRRAPPRGLWQSFADLSMGVMAVIILVLLVVLNRQAEENEEFTRMILAALQEGDQVVRNQNAVEQWLEALFKVKDCRLRYNPKDGQLTLESVSGEPTELYATGRVSLREEAQRDLRKCGDALLTLAVCLDGENEKACNERLRATLGDAQKDLQNRVDAAPEWTSVEALVIQGHTDRQRYVGARAVEGLPTAVDSHTASFVANAYLGAERARQAMGHLLAGVSETESGTTWPDSMGDAFPSYKLLAHIAVESPSFGQHQADPTAPKDPDCTTPSCESARRLALRIRWRPQSLRKPLEKVRKAFCARQFDVRMKSGKNASESDLSARVDAVCEEARVSYCEDAFTAHIESPSKGREELLNPRLARFCADVRPGFCERRLTKQPYSQDVDHREALRLNALCTGDVDVEPTP